MMFILILSITSYLIIDQWSSSLMIKDRKIIAEYQNISKLARIYNNLKERDKLETPPLKTELKPFIENCIDSIKLRDRLESIEPAPEPFGLKVSMTKLKIDEINEMLNLVSSKYSNVIIKEISINHREGSQPNSIQNPPDLDMKIYIERL